MIYDFKSDFIYGMNVNNFLRVKYKLSYKYKEVLRIKTLSTF